MYDYLVAVILGIVEGITEFLPISSTGHLILAQKLLGVSGPMWDSFEIMIQLGSILAVVVYFWPKIWGTVAGLFSDPRARYFALLLIVAVLPALVLGALFSSAIKHYLFNTTSIAITWIIGGLIILWVESTHRQDVHHEADDLPLSTGALIGLAQAVAMIPGTSRSAATIVGARLLGVDRRAAAEFSFFLAIPTMVAAFAFEAFKNRHDFDTGSLGLLGVGFVVSFVAAYLVIKPFLDYVSTRGFAPFAYYRILLGGIVLAFTFAVGM
jgi:undecaprenyl-diphosphatase